MFWRSLFFPFVCFFPFVLPVLRFTDYVWCLQTLLHQVRSKPKDFTSLPSAQLSRLKDKGRLKELFQLCFINKNGQRRYNYLVLGRDIFFLATLILTKSVLQLISSKCSSFWLTTYLLRLMDVFCNRQSTFQWVQTVLLFSLTCCFIRIMQTSYKDFLRKTKGR